MFQNVSLVWKGQQYTIDGRNLLPLIAQIEEEAATVFEICRMYAKGKPKGTVIAKALGIVLRYVGVADVNDEQVYRDVVLGRANDCLLTLVNIMAPSDQEPTSTDAGTDEKKPTAPDLSKPST